MFGPDVDSRARMHALSRYPRESVGYVVGGVYHPQENVARDPTREFAVRPEAWGDDVRGVVHSHTNGNPAPGRDDMEAQVATGVPWGIGPSSIAPSSVNSQGRSSRNGANSLTSSGGRKPCGIRR